MTIYEILPTKYGMRPTQDTEISVENALIATFIGEAIIDILKIFFTGVYRN